MDSTNILYRLKYIFFNNSGLKTKKKDTGKNAKLYFNNSRQWNFLITRDTTSSTIS